MTNDMEKQNRIQEAAKRALAEAEQRRINQQETIMTKEYNGPKGKEPTRNGDWERKGIVYDF